MLLKLGTHMLLNYYFTSTWWSAGRQMAVRISRAFNDRSYPIMKAFWRNIQGESCCFVGRIRGPLAVELVWIFFGGSDLFRGGRNNLVWTRCQILDHQFFIKNFFEISRSYRRLRQEIWGIETLRDSRLDWLILLWRWYLVVRVIVWVQV
jgi:hypothetical protein